MQSFVFHLLQVKPTAFTALIICFCLCLVTVGSRVSVSLSCVRKARSSCHPASETVLEPSPIDSIETLISSSEKNKSQEILFKSESALQFAINPARHPNIDGLHRHQLFNQHQFFFHEVILNSAAETNSSGCHFQAKL